ncbi:MAG: hypothetical protein Q9227_006788 [Pyrenula ochraceoflavens]
MPPSKSSRTSNGAKRQQKETVVFLHPDLGIGGAERLVVDAAVGLQEQGHRVVIYTSHCDKSHCFEEARDGTLDVRVRAPTWLPASLLGRFHILLAVLRQFYLLLAVSLPSPRALLTPTRRTGSAELLTLSPDVFIVDQLSAGLPLLRWLWPDLRILFYCHFPDQLLAQKETGLLIRLIKKPYRWLFDQTEIWTMQAADRVVVNSEFTRNVAYNTLGKSIASSYEEFAQGWGIIYPCVNSDTPSLSNQRTNGSANKQIHSTAEESSDASSKLLWPPLKVFLSINRFERKKGITLAIRAFANLKQPHQGQSRLVIAGGYDPNLRENSQYHKELVFLCEELGLSNATARTIPTALAVPAAIRVLFLLSVPSSFKSELLFTSNLLIYTPENEHFGIVPVEAMAAGLPVLASNTGGPLESIVEGKTGWLRPVDDISQWSQVMQRVLELDSTSDGQKELSLMGRAGKERATKEFGRNTMSKRFQYEIDEMLQIPRKDFLDWREILQGAGIVAAVIMAATVFALQAWSRRKTQFNVR